MILRPYQITKSYEVGKVLDKNNLVYIAMQERTGKTLIALEVMRTRCKRVLILTKKGKPLQGWIETLEAFPTDTLFEVTNYHQACKLEPVYDGVILDESHNYLSAKPKKRKLGKLYLSVIRLTKRVGVKLVYVSATPHAQGRVALYPQLGLSFYSPFKQFTNFYQWHKVYGVQDLAYLPGRQQETYNKCKEDEVAKLVSHLFVTGTRKEVGFDIEPEDEVHYITLESNTKKAYNVLLNKKVLNATSLPATLICDNGSKLRSSLHQFEGGTLKFDTSIEGETKKSSKCVFFKNTEKIDYILAKWGDTDKLVIMYHYQCEQEKLLKYFKHAEILQASVYAEGVDLSMYDTLVIYSQDWSTAKYIQRRARQANQNRVDKIIVHFLVVRDAISAQVYKTVAINKVNFTDKLFERKTLE